MEKIDNFYNDGTGWVCIQCERERALETELASSHSRFYREGEAESKFPQLASRARAKWFDRLRETLVCPSCGVTERVSRS